MKYDGEWENNNPHGKMSITHIPTQKIFECNYINGKRDGLATGTFLHNDGSEYQGNWSNDKNMDMVFILIPMVRNMPDIGNIMRDMDRVNLPIRIIPNMMVNGKIIKSMVWE